MSHKLKTLFAISIAFCALNTQAITQNDVQVTFAGTQGVGTGSTMVYIYLGATNPHNCLWSGVYFTDEALRKEALVIALAAKAFNKPVRIDYTGGAGAMCIGSGIFSQ